MNSLSTCILQQSEGQVSKQVATVTTKSTHKINKKVIQPQLYKPQTKSRFFLVIYLPKYGTGISCKEKNSQGKFSNVFISHFSYLQFFFY